MEDLTKFTKAFLEGKDENLNEAFYLQKFKSRKDAGKLIDTNKNRVGKKVLEIEEPNSGELDNTLVIYVDTNKLVYVHTLKVGDLTLVEMNKNGADHYIIITEDAFKLMKKFMR